MDRNNTPTLVGSIWNSWFDEESATADFFPEREPQPDPFQDQSLE